MYSNVNIAIDNSLVFRQKVDIKLRRILTKVHRILRRRQLGKVIQNTENLEKSFKMNL